MNINKVKINNELISRCKPDFSICRLKGFPSAPFPLRLHEPNTKKPNCNMQGPGLLLRCDMHPYSLRLYPASFMFEACVQMCLCVCMHMHVHVHGHPFIYWLMSCIHQFSPWSPGPSLHPASAFAMVSWLAPWLSVLYLQSTVIIIYLEIWFKQVYPLLKKLY